MKRFGRTLVPVALAIGVVLASAGVADAASQIGHTSCASPRHPVVSANVDIVTNLVFTYDNGAGGKSVWIPKGYSTTGTGRSDIYGTSWALSNKGTITSATGSCS